MALLECLYLWPVAIIEDRYSGVYSGGKWVAIARSDLPGRFESVMDGTQGDDITAGEFGYVIKKTPWIACGNTPDDALANLQNKCAEKDTQVELGGS